MTTAAARAVIDQRAQAAAELLRRRRARVSLEDFAQAVDVPGRPVSEDPDAWLFKPVESPLALHHRVILRALQRCMTTRYGRLMIFAPPGSAKSSYASVVAPTWFMGARSGSRVILASYATQIATKQSRRARQICRSEQYRGIFGAMLPKDQSAVESWALDNGSEMMAAGILAGITGNRANGIIIDDPIAGREEADSPVVRRKTWDALNDDLKSRLVPGGWQVLIATRWHTEDPAGMLLPDDYDGQSGPVRCSDGLTWDVLCLPAECERDDDPLGRKRGELLWPEWFDAQHWSIVRDAEHPGARRTWATLYQQRPTVSGGAIVRHEHLRWYSPGDEPQHLRIYLASDFATTADGGDYTEHGVFGIDTEGNLWALDWWSGQVDTDAGVDAALSLIKRWRPMLWIGERGVIESAIGGQIRRAMAERKVHAPRELLPSLVGKTIRLQAFADYGAAGRVNFPAGIPWAVRVASQLVDFPSGRHDDAVDVCSLIGRALDRIVNARQPEARKAPIVPFSPEWVEYQDKIDAQRRAQRQQYLT